ncbi:hypothetical protein EV188_107170 [Actinomycetospora succinea]|uniref:Uncharacterized protein n=1 Tax=Actinomycetospora succinea TaxID=663603 RepID=A0A4R6V2E7_9PSEU|nr:hypothetical protein [Actinomycetospora succinea]TDQ52793.1 hypothetical protein EV188_107170 [Actinomycetospora succinea]
MTAPEEAGGPWLDMSRYPDTDPDTVLSPGDQDLLTSALAVDDSGLPDSVWEHMLAVVTGEDPAEDADEPGTDGGVDDPALDPADDAGWGEDPAHDQAHDDPGGHDDGIHDAGHDGHDWDGGVV